MEHDDIVERRITWLIVLAVQRGSPAQLRDLELCYGKSDQESVARVQEIYTDLRLNRNIPIYIEQKMADIEKDIQQIAKVDREGLSQSLFFNLLQDISLD
ncbi:farnesyl pyrophosphate synthase [Eurytemora carolleeae]|uniref:farnesyl pyrophosphate synthase n=1 Tax=Eurytemora carolleeae TaxID=1294199 RepID=UPI000C76624A|nr:farnesyl pyrophosphate synthase [Eurytemora carolleeae]|eukprot:XP_023343207.1 farnesyl pyrophosphate synthase-like [Eurytemora affinis]